jgi:hypothetical protein
LRNRTTSSTTAERRSPQSSSQNVSASLSRDCIYFSSLVMDQFPQMFVRDTTLSH